MATAFLALSGVAAACGGSEPPDYPDVVAIAEALHDHGIECVLTVTTVSEPSSARSTGRCEGDGWVLQLVVYSSAGARDRASVAAEEASCELDIRNATGVWGERWGIGYAMGDDGEIAYRPGAPYAEDLAEATGGELVRTCD